ncbi:caax prenyl protease 1 [Holotrichia oblita]|uniref:Caax prenyl protease 1 n=1 Tax=Holotrichia oblita TaxID=644536 RepID=A0ACB9ST63_HOLOL|nr:caax prenyl protease 1 [Holotrichia oblita]
MDVLNQDCVLYIILLFLWLEYLWEIYLAIRQYNVTKKTVNVPTDLSSVMTKDTFDKARLYSMDKNKYGIVNDTFTIFVSTLVIYYGLLARVWKYSESINPWEGEVSISSIWIFLLMTMTTIINLPLAVYYTFVLEEKYGFNKQTARFFIIDKIKAFVLNQVIVLPMSALTIVIVKYGGDLFFVWLWMVIGIFMLILLTIYPSYIAPLFDKYTPLPEAQLYVVEGSKRSAHSNAYFYGLFKSKRIVLFDTLLKNPDSGGCKNDEILAVLSHELGHWSHGHIIKNLIIMQVNLFFIFAAFSFLFKFSPLYQAVGFPVGVEPVLVGLMVVMQYVMMPYNALLSFILTCLSRKFEFQADEFAMKLGRAEPLKRALIQLNKDNLGFPIYDTLYSMWHHSHPPLLERIAALKPKKD